MNLGNTHSRVKYERCWDSLSRVVVKVHRFRTLECRIRVTETPETQFGDNLHKDNYVHPLKVASLSLI